jgi:glutaredoxin-like protein NrdH
MQRDISRAKNAGVLDFTVVDIAEDAEARDYVMSLGYRHAPVLITDQTHWSGRRPDRMVPLRSRPVA